MATNERAEAQRQSRSFRQNKIRVFQTRIELQQRESFFNSESNSGRTNGKIMCVAFRMTVIESEANWGRKIDDYMVCKTSEDAVNFRTEFNAKNTEEEVPEWYMQAEGEPEQITITDAQQAKLETENRVWWSVLKQL